MMPRSSRSHSTLVPAARMIPSQPHVSSPSRRQATIGNDPPSARRSDGGRVGPRQTSSMPPVPNVTFVMPGRTQPWPGQRALLVADQGGDRAAPARRRPRPGPWPRRPGRRCRRAPAGRPPGCAASRAPCRTSRSASGVSRPVVAALDGSVTCSAPPDRCQATHVSTVPTTRSRLRSGSAASSRWRALVADSLGASVTPSPCRTRQSPTVRRSCQPRPGPTGSPVARSHTMVDARWLVMPTAATGPPSASAARATSSAASAISVASNSTRPGAGEEGRTGRWWTAATVASGRTTAARTPDVPTSTTRIDRSSSPLVLLRSGRSARCRRPLAHRRLSRRRTARRGADRLIGRSLPDIGAGAGR